MPSRVRRDPRVARAAILDAAADLLAAGGPGAVQVRAVAQRVGMTDAGVTHHFGSRAGLLEALLRHGGRRLRAAIASAVADWTDGEPDIGPLVEALASVYRAGYSELAIALHAAGWRDEGSGMLAPLVDAVHARRGPTPDGRPPRIEDTRLAIAALHSSLATDPIFGPLFRRSVGIDDPDAVDAQVAWWVATLTTVLGLPPPVAGE